MKHHKFRDISEKYRPGAFAPVGDFFIRPESPCGSIFLLAGDLWA
jgi:hypothetical protein